ALAIGLSMGATALVARRVGEGDLAGARVVAGQCIWLGLVVALLVGVPGVIWAGEILRVMGAGAALPDDGYAYTAITLGSAVTVIYLFLLNAVFRGAGDATVAMRSLWL